MEVVNVALGGGVHVVLLGADRGGGGWQREVEVGGCAAALATCLKGAD